MIIMSYCIKKHSQELINIHRVNYDGILREHITLKSSLENTIQKLIVAISYILQAITTELYCIRCALIYSRK